MNAITPLVRLQSSHNAMIFQYKENAYRLNAGTRDTIHIFTRSICLYVLTINSGLGYVGLDLYYPSEQEPVMTIFLHSDYQITEALGPKWKQMIPSTIASKLSDYLM